MLIRSVSRHLTVSLIACAVLAALILALMPAEQTLGQVIKIVYLHGALSRAGMVGLVAGGIAGLAFLLLGQRPRWLAWSNALVLSGWAFWTAHFLVSMPATRLTWGPWIAWGEPRVTMTLQIIGAGLAVYVVSRLLCDASFSAGANALLGLAVAVLVAQSGVLRHPLDPIGGSPSDLLRLVYALLLLPIIAAMLLVALRLTSSTSLVCRYSEEGTLPDHAEA